MAKATKPNSAPQVVLVYDPSTNSRRPRAGGRSNFTAPDHRDGRSNPLSANQQDNENEELDINKILKDIQYLGSSNMTWKERKKLENEKVVSLGGKAPKKHRISLSVGKFHFKKQKQREEKRIEEEQILGRFTKHSNNRKVEKRKAEDRVLKASEGHFCKGVLNVKHLLERKSSGGSSDPSHKMSGKGKKKGKGRGRGKGKGKGKKRRN